MCTPSAGGAPESCNPASLMHRLPNENPSNRSRVLKFPWRGKKMKKKKTPQNPKKQLLGLDKSRFAPKVQNHLPLVPAAG